MKKVKLLAIGAISLSLVAFMSSCTNEDAVGSDASLTATAVDEAQVSSISDQVINTAEDYALNFESAGYKQNSNSANGAVQKMAGSVTDETVIVTVDKDGLTVFPKKICIDFGTTGFTDKRGNVLKGKIYLVISARMSVAGSSRTFQFVDFFVNDNAVKGTKTVTYNGDASGFPSWSIVANDTIVRPDGINVIWSSNRTRSRIDNNNTPLIYWDDMYSIKGSSNGVNAKGVAYSMTIDEAKPLIIGGGCPFFVKGVIIISTEKRTALIDYGDGTKDAKATVTINGVTKQFNLRK